MALVKREQRICFGLEWYDSEEEAVAAGKKVFESGRTVNGGFFHGMPCGRDRSFDYTDDAARKLFAVRT